MTSGDTLRITMEFISTAGGAPPCDLKMALFRGLPPDGGLYMPSPLEPLPQEQIHALRGAELTTTALAVARHLFRDVVEDDRLETLIKDALDFEIPLVRLDERLFVLELFHGPTLAFKDVGARCMARLMAGYGTATDRPLTVITATSGDTGGAVAHAFHDLPDTRVVILFPAGQVSPVQRRQFTTLGRGVEAVAVAGRFDDCQRLAKEALADDDLRERLTLTSANSINVGRLLPQVFYYFHGWTQLPEGMGEVVVSTPSGNFGNLTAGLMAMRLGLEISVFVAATNVNYVVPEYLQTGVFRPRDSVRTISSAMDVGNPSNFARMLALYEGREEELQRDVLGSTHTDEETREAIAEVYRQYGYILDPHSAVGYLGLMQALSRDQARVGILLATAHPAKFAETVEPLIGQALPVPERLAVLLDRQERVTELAPSLAELKRLLLR